VPAAAMPPIPAPMIAILGDAMIVLLLIVEDMDRCPSPPAANIGLVAKYVKYIFYTELILYKYVSPRGGKLWN
jgi:hypothetical protein